MILFTFFIKTFKLLFTLILSLLIGIILPLIIIILSPIYLFRWIIFHTASIFKPELGKMLTTRSTSMILEDDIYGTPKLSEIFSGVMEGRPSIEHIRDTVTRHAINTRSSKTGELLYPELKQNVTFVLGFPFWTPVKDFKLEDHVYEAEEYINQPLDYNALTKLMIDLGKKPFSKGKAMWEIIFIRNYIPNSKVYGNMNDDNQYSLIIFRQHHVMADGFAKLKFLRKLGNNPPLVRNETSGSRRSNKSTSFLDVVSMFCLPFTLPFSLAESCVTKLTAIPLKWELKGPKCGSIHFSNTDLIPVADIKEIKSRYGVSFNAVVINGVARCIEKLLLSPTGESIRNLPSSVDILMPFPLPNHPEKLRNHMIGALVPIPIGQNKDDPVERLKAVERALTNIKRSKSRMVLNKYFMLFVGGLPIPFTRPLIKQLKSNHSILLTNFPGPSETLDLLGCPMKETFLASNTVAGTNMVVFAFVSLGGYSRFTVGADSSIIPSNLEADYLTEEFCKELEILRKWKGQNDIV